MVMYHVRPRFRRQREYILCVLGFRDRPVAARLGFNVLIYSHTDPPQVGADSLLAYAMLTVYSSIIKQPGRPI